MAHYRLSGRLMAAAGTLVIMTAWAIAAEVQQSMPIYKAPPGATAQQSGNWYIWADGSYHSVKLPHYDIGFIRRLGPVLATDSGPAEGGYNPRATGTGVSGAIGYVLDNPPPWRLLGTNTRIELGGSYVTASDRQAGASSPFFSFAELQVSGLVFNGPFACAFPPTCTTRSTLATDYSTWQMRVQLATDYSLSALTLSPSVAGFVGQGRTKQDGSQALLDANGIAFAHYEVNSSLRWTDWGGKIGADFGLPVNRWATLSVGGSAGWAVRNVSFDAKDLTDAPVPMGGLNPVTSASFTGQSDSTVAAILNAEGRVVIRPVQNVSLKAFAGVTYDSRVPGVAGPNFVGNGPTGFVLQSVPGVQGTPASITYASETSFYAGGGLTVTFGPR
jgi:hypothetical protein